MQELLARVRSIPQFLLYLGCVLTAAGEAVNQVEEHLRRVAAAYGVPAHVVDDRRLAAGEGVQARAAGEGFLVVLQGSGEGSEALPQHTARRRRRA